MISKFKDFIKESIIDIPRRTYAPGVFDNADTDNPKLKQKVLDIIKKDLKTFEKFGPVVSVKLIGSILGKRYRNDADLDIDVLIDLPPEDRETIGLEARKSVSLINGRNIPGTKHPINYYVQSDPAVNDAHLETADGIFDVFNQKFDKRPKDHKFDPKVYQAEFEKKVSEIDVVKGELKRDIVDYEELKELSPKDIEGLQKKISEKLKEIEDAIEKFSKMGDELMQARRDLFNRPMTPEEIKKYGVAHKLPKNVIFKYLEKYHYITFMKKCKEILDDGKVTDKEIDSLKEATGSPRKHIAFTFGRFNPPTIGHEKLINKVASVRANEYLIIPTKTTDAKKNPLKITDKLRIMKQMFPRHSAKIKQIPGARTAMEVLNNLNGKANEITMVVGSDRVREFDSLLNKYNGIKARGTNYKFDKINVVSAGERDPDAEGAMGMSASKMRDAASKNDLVSFKRGLPISYRDKDGLFKLVRKGMNLENMSGAGLGTYAPSADINPTAKRKVIVEKFTQWQIRDLYIREQLFNKNDIVNDIEQEVTGKVIRRSTNYIVLEDNQSNLHKCWIWNCLPVSNVDEVKLHEHNLDVDYGFEAVSETEVKMSKQKTYEDIKKREESYEIGKDYANHTKEITPGETPSEKPIDSKTRAEQSAEKIDKEDIKNWASASETIDKYKTRYGEDWEKELEEATNKMEERLKVQSFKEFNNSQGD
jgi:predicted nucleotidyltransferase